MPETTTPRSIEDIEDRLDEIRADIQNLDAEFAGQKFDDVARESWNRLNDEKAKLETTRTELLKRRDRLREFAGNPHATERAQSPTDPGNLVTGVPAEPPEPFLPAGMSRRDAIPALWPSAEDARRLHRAALNGSNLRLESRAVVTTALTGAAELAVPLAQRGRRERRIVVAAGLGAESVAGVTTAQYPVFGAGDAGITPEGGTKTEYSAITPGESTPQVIAIWTDTTRQNVLTMPTFEGKLRTVLAAKVARREDVLVTATVLATPGIQTLVDATLDADTVLLAAGMVAAGDVAAEPNLCLVNPDDLPAVVGTTVGTGGSASPDFGTFLPSVHGLQLYPTAAIPAGELLVGAWNAAAHFIVGIPPTFLIDAFSAIKTNAITMLLEEAVNIAVDEPQGFVHVTAA